MKTTKPRSTRTKAATKTTLTSKERGLKYGYRSGLEETIGRQIAEVTGRPPEYEQLKIHYEIPTRKAKYTPDFVLPNGVIIESKGRFEPDDRKKHLLVQAQHPEYDIRFVFSNSKQKIRKGSKTSYADWCEDNGFLYADKTIPLAWFE